MSDAITGRQFASLAAFLASRAASWAGDTLTSGMDLDKPISRDVAQRFVAQMRELLASIEE